MALRRDLSAVARLRLLEEGETALASTTLGQALRLRREEPLTEFAYPGFADAERAHLAELALVAIETRVEADHPGKLRSGRERAADRPNRDRRREALPRVHAAGADRGVWHLTAGLPHPVRLAGYGIRAPKTPVPGREAAGRVEAAGEDVTTPAVGDEVFGIAATTAGRRNGTPQMMPSRKAAKWACGSVRSSGGSSW